jgi:hypothetical protein
MDSFNEEEEDDGDGSGRQRNHMGVEILPPILEEDELDEGKEEITFTDSVMTQSHGQVIILKKSRKEQYDLCLTYYIFFSFFFKPKIVNNAILIY